MEDKMRDATLLGARLLLGSYMGFHASQKLFGKFHGPGLDGAGAMFEKHGLAPGKRMATAAAATEIAAGPGKYKIGPSLPGWLTALGVVGGGALAGALIAKMVTAQPGEPPAVPDLAADPAPELAND
jgi:DoxX-like protein